MEGRPRLRLTAGLLALALVAGACDGGSGPDSGGEAGERPGPAELPDPRTEVAGTAWRGDIVVVGGLAATGDAVAFVDRYAPDADAWSRLPDYPVPVHHAAVVTLDDRVWVVGGYTNEAGQWRALDAVHSLGEGEDQWREEVRLPEPRGALAAAVVEGGGDPSLVVAGGVVPDGAVLASALQLDRGAAGDRWVSLAPMATEREHFALAAVGGTAYALAGRAGGMETNRDSVEALDLAGAAGWAPAGTLSRSRGGFGAATVGGRPCVAGGETPTGTVVEIECLVGGAWEVVARLSEPRHGLAVVALGSRLHVIGGGPEPGLTVSGVHEVFDLG